MDAAVTPAEIIALIVATVPGVTLLWQMVQFLSNKNTEAKNRQFETYHRLIKELVEPSDKGPLYVDRQCAVVFELRRFKPYRQLTVRTLEGLREDWKDHPNFHHRLDDEITLTLDYLKN
jgi:hypothetical protein